MLGSILAFLLRLLAGAQHVESLGDSVAPAGLHGASLMCFRSPHNTQRPVILKIVGSLGCGTTRSLPAAFSGAFDTLRRYVLCLAVL